MTTLTEFLTVIALILKIGSNWGEIFKLYRWLRRKYRKTQKSTG
jgi:hypothetical protein